MCPARFSVASASDPSLSLELPPLSELLVQYGSNWYGKMSSPKLFDGAEKLSSCSDKQLERSELKSSDQRGWPL